VRNVVLDEQDRRVILARLIDAVDGLPRTSRLTARLLEPGCAVAAAIDGEFRPTYMTVRRALAIDVAATWFENHDPKSSPLEVYARLLRERRGVDHWAWDWITGSGRTPRASHAERMLAQQEAVVLASELIALCVQEGIELVVAERRVISAAQVRIASVADAQVRTEKALVLVRDGARELSRALALEGLIAAMLRRSVPWVGVIDVESGQIEQRALTRGLVDEGVDVVGELAQRYQEHEEAERLVRADDPRRWEYAHTGPWCSRCPLAGTCPVRAQVR
jgi:hypothetical protein